MLHRRGSVFAGDDLREAVEALRPHRKIALQIFATDLDAQAIDAARLGYYSDNITADVSPERLRRFFVSVDRGYRVGKDIREMVVFAPQNVAMDPPFTKLDIVSCRNLLIYLGAEQQKKTHSASSTTRSTPAGSSFSGAPRPSESSPTFFTRSTPSLDIFRRLDVPTPDVPVEFPSRVPMSRFHGEDAEASSRARPQAMNMQGLVDRLIVQRFAPLGVLCNDKGDILYISGRAGKYLEPAVGKANLNIFAMSREGLRLELPVAFAQAVRSEGPVTLRGIIIGTNGGTQTVDLSVEKLNEPKELRGTVLVMVADLGSEARASRAVKSHKLGEPARVAELELELHQIREEVQITREEMQTSQEELKSTNEELQSTNEELQATNEELATSKEEMQSLNEELQTVNPELQDKVDELSRTNNDMKNLLNCTDIATLFLDGELRVRRFTTQTARIIKLIPADAGRAITDIASDLAYPELADDAREVLRTLVFSEKTISGDDGSWFNVRIMPYRTLENVIDGVVITFTDSSAARALEDALREQASQAKQLAESLPALVWGCATDGSCDYLNPRWLEYTGVEEKKQLGYGWLQQVHEDDRARVREEWRIATHGGAAFESEFRLRSTSGAYRWFNGRSVPIRDAQGRVLKWYGTNTDVHDLKRAEEGRREDADRLCGVLEGISDGFVLLEPDLTIRYVNAAAERFLHQDRPSVAGKRLFDAIPDLRGTAFEEKLAGAVRAKARCVFEAHVTGGALRGWYSVRVHPQRHAEGISIFFERSSSRPSEAEAGDSHGQKEVSSGRLD